MTTGRKKTRLRAEKWVWVTWLAKLMVGETTCEWSPWFRSTYQDWERVGSEFDNSQWQIAHTRLLRELRAKEMEAGREVFTERQAEFVYRRPSGLAIAGVPDLVSLDRSGGTVTDAKTGRHRASHAVQTKLYMHLLPLARPDFSGHVLDGRVEYEDGHRTLIGADAIDGEFRDQFEYFVRILEADEPPLRVPTARECSFCDIGPADCPDRIS